jgi:hypothetical protein
MSRPSHLRIFCEEYKMSCSSLIHEEIMLSKRNNGNMQFILKCYFYHVLDYSSSKSHAPLWGNACNCSFCAGGEAVGYTLQQRIFIVTQYIRSGSYARTQEAFSEKTEQLLQTNPPLCGYTNFRRQGMSRTHREAVHRRC